VVVDANSPIFQFYSGGIINSPDCGVDTNHGVLAVGYGIDATSKLEYFIVKNSWGPTWGMKGYVNIAAVEGFGICGIQSNGLYPTF
jgi:C1A family cysteine protease